MTLRTVAAATLPLAVALTVGSGVSHAQPSTPDIRYETHLVGNSIITTLTDGTFRVVDDHVTIEDAAGNPVTSLPLSFRQDGLEFPLPHRVLDNGTVLELTAVRDFEKARPVKVQPVASAIENLRAQSNFETRFGIATAVGTFIGTALGGAVGLIGFLAGGLGIATVATGAAIGGIIGTVVVGGPALLIAGIEMLNTFAAAPNTTQWADKPRAAN
ncbi:ammonium transporter [Nocardia bovistercoris]|uniref:Ammonium transporter n=1 Tax=Nocardia bovistercoris TaxID=2785916 RepID=A0A931IHM7_9NOCA|nr:ammonium transporter [Nocardia bovistercoris]MBH0781604.1 ammonium transporter [Nocardia bovistercoris]